MFTYTLSDGSATDIATLTITITGQTDGAPLIVANDGNAGATGQATVYEVGLTSAGDTSEATTGTITVTAPDGIKSVTIGGQVFTVAQLDVLTAGSPSAVIDTGEGELRITGISNKTGAPGAPISADVSYTYTLKAAITNTLPADTESTDTIALVVTDNSATPKTGTGNLLIQIIDDTPLAADDTNSITKGTATVTDNAYTNDSIGADGTTMGGPVTAITGGTPGAALTGTYGAITLNADGSYSYALDNANPDVVGLMGGQTLTDTFTYTISDKDGDTSTATITITINGVTPNNIPIARSDSFTTQSGTPVSNKLTDNDSLGDGSTSQHIWSKATDPSNGTVIVNSDGTFTYTPNPGFGGTDSFNYTIKDINGDASTTTVTITVNGVPVATDDSATTPPNTPLNGSLKSNDTPSPDGGNVWTKTSNPGKGTVTVNPDGTYIYTPNPGATGTDTFTYTITDKEGDTSTATVTITVNNLPIAVNDSFTTETGKPVAGNLASNDTPSIDGGNVWTKTSDPDNGTVTVNPDGSFTYTPKPGFSGTDTFTYTVTDKNGDKSTATATIIVDAAPPVVPPVEPPVEPPVVPTPVIPEINKPNPENNLVVDANRYAPSPVLPIPTLPGDGPQLQPEAPLQPRNALDSSPVILDTGPYFSGERFDDVRRLPLPFHPIVYVNREVVNAQLARVPNDVRFFSQPGMGTPGDINLLSQATGLGSDQNLFVQHSVRDTQRHASFLGSTVDGRLGRVSLSGDWLLPTPELFQPDSESLLFSPLDKDPKEQGAATQDNVGNIAPAAKTEQAERKVSADSESPTPTKPITRLVAPSFAQQLRNAAGRLPVPSRNI